MTVEKKSAYRMGWIVAMFDLPVVRDEERRAASKFRHDLLDHGYIMVQFSVYARPCVSYEQMESHIDRVKKLIPEAGNVRLMFMTDEQWKKSYTVIGGNYRQKKNAQEPDIPEQVEFWE